MSDELSAELSKVIDEAIAIVGVLEGDARGDDLRDAIVAWVYAVTGEVADERAFWQRECADPNSPFSVATHEESHGGTNFTGTVHALGPPTTP